MSVTIKSGSSGDVVDVTPDNHLKTASRTATEEFEHTIIGKSWNINPGTFAFTGRTISSQ